MNIKRVERHLAKLNRWTGERMSWSDYGRETGLDHLIVGTNRYDNYFEFWTSEIKNVKDIDKKIRW